MAIFKGRARELIRNKMARIKDNGGNWQPGSRLSGALQNLGGGGRLFNPDTGALQVEHQFQKPAIPWTAIAIGGAAVLTLLFATRR